MRTFSSTAISKMIKNNNYFIIEMRTYEQSALASTAIRKSAFARSMSSKRDLFTWWQSFKQKKT